MRRMTPQVGPALLGTALIATGAGLLFRSFGDDESGGDHRADDGVMRAITVGRSPAELFRLWPQLLPQTMEPFADVRVNGSQTHWQLRNPVPDASWDTEIVETRPDELLRWSAIEKSGFAGSVRFSPAPGNRGTEVALRVNASVPSAIAGPVLRSALRRFKSLVETGELPSLERNPSGRSAAGDA